MTDTRNILRNRRTGETYAVNSVTSLTPLSRQSVFTKSIDYSAIDEFVQHFAASLPQTLTQHNKEKILIQVRQAFAGKDKEINAIMTASAKQATKSDTDSSLAGYLKLLGTSLISAKLDAVFPGLAFLVMNVAPAAAQTDYTYYQGQPVGGEDMCAKALYDCIQGYLTEIGQEWKNDMPQIARLVEQNTTDISNCVNQQDLQNMLARAYRGPNEFASNCSVSAIANNGVGLTVNATNVDPITCDIMKDSLIGFSQHCPKPSPVPPQPPKPTSFTGVYIGFGIAGGALLALLAFGLYRALKKPRQGYEMVQEKGSASSQPTV